MCVVHTPTPDYWFGENLGQPGKLLLTYETQQKGIFETLHIFQYYIITFYRLGLKLHDRRFDRDGTHSPSHTHRYLTLGKYAPLGHATALSRRIDWGSPNII